MQDHVHTLIPIPLNHLVAEVIGYLKGKRRFPSTPPLRGGVLTQYVFRASIGDLV